MADKNLSQETVNDNKFVVKRKSLLIASIFYALLFLVTVFLFVNACMRATTIPIILFVISGLFYAYCSLYVLSRTQYDCDVLVVSFRKMIIFGILTIFAALAPLYLYFGSQERTSVYMTCCLVSAIVGFVISAYMILCVVFLHKKARAITAEKRKKKRR